MELASSMKTKENAVLVSSLVKRGDSLNEKASTVNMNLSRTCMESKIEYLDNGNISLEHLQGECIGGNSFESRGKCVLKIVPILMMTQIQSNEKISIEEC